ncbi:hypothetical protein CrV_gp091 [Cylindrospermopsis raciborskii virus RM-2018a]|jgi:tetratricopeptide (TPR) repeat protein|nr:hypothetical protein CrV_gp091 [Cylindrospermopsis raciborskii virus RM-2018a]WHL30663.1 hypothetical protein CrLKS4_g97 [Cylindrospermopsis phage Cr-LKS4]
MKYQDLIEAGKNRSKRRAIALYTESLYYYNGSDSLALYYRAKEYNDLELYEEALEDLDKYLDTDNKHILRSRIMAFYEKAKALKGLNRDEEAQQVINEAQELMPGFEP